MKRKFFPSSSVQVTPGKRVELEMQLQKQVPTRAAAPVSENDVIGAAWYLSLLGGYGSATEQPDQRVEASGESQLVNRTGWWEGDSEFNGEGELLTLENPAFQCNDLEVDISPFGLATIVGVLQARSMTNARWTVEWDSPDPDNPNNSLKGVIVTVLGNMLWVHVNNMEGSSSPPEILIAKAYSNEEEVAELLLKVRYPGW